MTTRVVLGSASSGRLRVLRNAGIDPLVVVSGVDEDAIVANLGPDAEPGDVVTTLAQAKAGTVHRVLDSDVAADCVVIGCDSMLYLDGQLRGKPGTPEQAVLQWSSMAGRVGLLYTGHCAIRVLHGAAARTATQAAVTRVRFASPSPAELAAYVSSGEPLQVAGAFTLDGLGGWFVDGIDGDPSNVVGLGLSSTRRLLGEVGLSIGELWAANPVR
jgi:septum formation protein